MNLTYDDFTTSGVTPEHRALSHNTNRKAMRLAHRAKEAGMIEAHELGGFFKSVKKSLKRTILHPVNVMKQQIKHGPIKGVTIAHKQEFQGVKEDIKGMGSVIAPVASAFGPIGAVVGGVVGGAKVAIENKEAKDAAKAEAAQIAADTATIQRALDEVKSPSAPVLTANTAEANRATIDATNARLLTPMSAMTPGAVVQGPSLASIGVTPDVSAQVASAMKSLQDQGASQSQMVLAALQQLSARGVNTASPDVQAAVKAEVADAKASAVPMWAWLAGGAVLAFFLLKRR